MIILLYYTLRVTTELAVSPIITDELFFTGTTVFKSLEDLVLIFLSIYLS